MANTHELIQTITVGTNSPTSIDFTSIPQTYTDLKLLLSIRSSAASNLFISFNSDVTDANYGRKNIYTDDYSTIGQFATTDRTAGFVFAMSTNAFCTTEVYIPSYTSSYRKAFHSQSYSANNGTTSSGYMTCNQWFNTAAITAVKVSGGTYSQYTTASLYGIKNS
jgi:hypothetical protein